MRGKIILFSFFILNGVIQICIIPFFLFKLFSSFNIFMYMATYGINFPFTDSPKGDYLKMTETPELEIRSNLIHLLLTRKGTRYYMPDFGTRLYEFIFEPNDSTTFNLIENDIRDAINTYIPNLNVNSINITSALEDDSENSVSENDDNRLFRVSSESTKEYTAKVRIDYTVNNGSFSSSDFIIINI